MIYGSVCSGIEAATVAWHTLGWKPAFFSEIEAFPRSVLAHHYPETPLHGDFTTIGADDYGPIDLLVGGTPCQSFSIAGLRGGLDDDRGNLALEFLRLADRTRPRWLVWENVPGVLSSNGGRDFGAILGGMAELGYGFAYRVLDAQFFGLAQRRRRVFVVGHLGDWRRAAAVLFERHSLSGHPAPSRKARQVAPTIHSRRTGGGGLGTDFDCDGGLINWPAEVAPTLNAAFGSKLGLEDQHIRGGWAGSLPDLGKFLTTGVGQRYDPETETLIPTIGGVFDVALETTHTLRAEGFDASEDGTGRGTPLVPVAFAQNTRDEVRLVGGDGSIVGALAAEAGMKQTSYVAFPAEMSATQCAATENLSPALSVKHTTAVAFSAKDYGADATEELSPTLRAGGHLDSHANGGVGPAVAFDMRGRDGGSQFEGPHDTANIRASSGGSSRSYVAASAVRRLTPREAERLQGFPDDYTLVTHRKKPAADGPRYKALGNSMAVPCMAWIGERIAKVDALP